MSTEQAQNTLASFGVLFPSAPPASSDTPVLHLDRATLDQAMEHNQTLWYYSDTTGWLQLQFSEPAALTNDATLVRIHFRSGSSADYHIDAEQVARLKTAWRDRRQHIEFDAERRSTSAAQVNGGDVCTVFLRLDDVLYID